MQLIFSLARSCVLKSHIHTQKLHGGGHFFKQVHKCVRAGACAHSTLNKSSDLLRFDRRMFLEDV